MGNSESAGKIPLQKWKTSDRGWLFTGGFSATLIALIIVNGFSGILTDTLKYPLSYSGDALLWLMQTKRVSEGWLYQNLRQGYPFGSNNLRYPGFDNAEFIIQKLLMSVGNFNYWQAMNIYLIISFPVCAAITHVVLKRLKCSNQIAFLGSLLYTFLPFHFYRFEHPTYIAYFIVPIYFLIGLEVYENQTKNSKISFRLVSRQFLMCIFLSTFGAYFTIFGIIYISAIILFSKPLQNEAKSFFYSLRFCIFLFVGLLVNLLPNIAYMILNRREEMQNPVVRGSVDAEVFAFKPLQLLLPDKNHVIKLFRDISTTYASSAPMVNENQGVSLGIVGSLGLILAGYFMFRKEKNNNESNVLKFLSVSVVFLLLVGTTGGLGTTLSYIGLKQIRAWNRISIFLAFGTIAIFCLCLQSISRRISNPVRAILVILILSIGIFDQVGGMYNVRSIRDNNEFDLSTEFIQKIENLSPSGTAIYSLPYMTFPESGNSHNLQTYQNGIGFLVSERLQWSYGALKFSDGDVFFSELSKQSIKKQLRIINRLGFGGIYVDVRGFADNGKLIIEEIEKDKTYVHYWRKDLNAVYFLLQEKNEPIKNGLNAEQIQRRACFVPNKRGFWAETC